MIHAIEAKQMAEKSLNDAVELNPLLLEIINNRIKNAASLGKTSITLSSISDSGLGVRGIGHFLTDNVTNELCKLLVRNGFKLDIDNPYDRHSMVVKVSW